MPHDKRKTAARALAAESGLPYTAARRAAVAARREDRFGGHEFEYEQANDLFRCTECEVYEVQARSADGAIAPCRGLVGYGGDTERVYLLLTVTPAAPYSLAAFLATSVRDTGIGRAPKWSWRDGKLLVESAPGVVDELVRRIERITTDVEGRPVSAVSSVDRLTAEAGRAIIAQNRAAYVAEYGEPA
ncbi:hypothetical protein ACQEU5_25155 [Marinactinospora thermotolerans]|uniref:hypothetical protein n=1 Tax=Marinactinospora thermotolerans TaxID=531310 RepID=UPI003D9369A5